MRIAGLLTLAACLVTVPSREAIAAYTRADASPGTSGGLSVCLSLHPIDLASGNLPVLPHGAGKEWAARALHQQQPSGSVGAQPADAETQAGLLSRYRWAIEGVVGLIVIQAGVIGWLLVERRLRQRAQQSLDDALRFERTFGQVAGLLAAGPASERAVHDALQRVAQYFDAEHAAVSEPATADRPFHLAAEYVAPGSTPLALDAERRRLPEVAAILDSGGTWGGDKGAPVGKPGTTSGNIGALMASPLRAAGQTGGALIASSVNPHPDWTREHERRLDAFGEVFANVLALRRARLILHEHEAFNRAVMGAHGGEVAVFDQSGTVVAVNEAWQRAADREHGVLADAQPGTSYAGGSKARPGQRPASMVSAIASVLNGGPPVAQADVEWDVPQGRTWCEVRVRRLERPEGGAVVSHMDITARKRADLQVQQHLHEMAHLNMVSAVGELAASVAHELNQPLAAVLSNAQALRRLMNSPSADPQLMREILEDVIAQNQRAGDVIQRMRRLLKKEKGDWQGVDLNQLVRDVAHMFQGEATLGGVPVMIDLAPSLPPVQGDRVQLQQVILNLLQNATHAVLAATIRDGGRVLVSTTLDVNGVAVRVRDAGPGIATDLLDRVFDPFFTTKRQGLGLGLAISRSIVELHGGHIVARNLPAGGAEFSFTIPVEAVSA